MEHIKHLTLGWLVGAAALLFAGCSGEDGVIEEQTPQQPAQTAATIHVTVGAGISDGEGATRSTVVKDGATRTLQFTSGDRLYVWGQKDKIYDQYDNYYCEYVVAGTLELVAIDPEDPTKATFSGELSVYEAAVQGDYAEGTDILMTLYGVTYPDRNLVSDLSGFLQSADPLGEFENVEATLIHEDAAEDVDYFISEDDRMVYYWPDCAATVEELMTTELWVSGDYDSGTKSFALAKDTDQPIVNCTISGLEAGVSYKVDYIYGTTAAMSDHTKTLYSSMTATAGTLAFAFIAATGDKFHGIRLTNTAEATDTYDATIGQKSFTSKVYNATRTAVHVPQTIDLSTSSNYYITARNGDVLTGTMSNGYFVEIVDGATVTLSGVNISNTLTPIVCRANAVIVLEGDNTLTAKDTGIQTWADYSEGDAVPTLEIKGTGSLNVTAVGNSHSAAIGSMNYRNSSQAVSCGNITISGGTVTATAGSYAAAIGCGQNGKCGAITISGGTVTASNNSSEYAAIGGKMSGDGSDCTSITITDGITSVTMTNSMTNGYLSSFAYAANINLDGFTLTADQQAKTPVLPSGSFYGLRFSYNGSSKTCTLTK